MIMYSVTITLTASGPDRAAHFEHVTDCYAMLERQHDDLLDSSWGFTDQGTLSEVEVAVTVQADDDKSAWMLASSSIRTAIHDAGGFTPSWDEAAEADLCTVVYRLADEGVAVLA